MSLNTPNEEQEQNTNTLNDTIVSNSQQFMNILDQQADVIKSEEYKQARQEVRQALRDHKSWYTKDQLKDLQARYSNWENPTAHSLAMVDEIENYIK